MKTASAEAIQKVRDCKGQTNCFDNNGREKMSSDRGFAENAVRMLTEQGIPSYVTDWIPTVSIWYRHRDDTAFTLRLRATGHELQRYC
jgi:hypothetical protein